MQFRLLLRAKDFAATSIARITDSRVCLQVLVLRSDFCNVASSKFKQSKHSWFFSLYLQVRLSCFPNVSSYIRKGNNSWESKQQVIPKAMSTAYDPKLWEEKTWETFYFSHQDIYSNYFHSFRALVFYLVVVTPDL